MKYYFDTAIWRDLHENRTDRFRPLGEWAFYLFSKIRDNKEKILYSRVVVEELLDYFEQKEVDEILCAANKADILEKVNLSEPQIREAKMLKTKLSIPYNDALHAILARDNNAIMVARDHHFEQLFEIVVVKKPEELI